MQQSEAFAKCISLNKTPLFFEFLDYKTRYRENVGVEVKGGNKNILPHPEQVSQLA